jgi:hypothetical protein
LPIMVSHPNTTRIVGTVIARMRIKAFTYIHLLSRFLGKNRVVSLKNKIKNYYYNICRIIYTWGKQQYQKLSSVCNTLVGMQVFSFFIWLQNPSFKSKSLKSLRFCSPIFGFYLLTSKCVLICTLIILRLIWDKSILRELFLDFKWFFMDLSHNLQKQPSVVIA